MTAPSSEVDGLPILFRHQLARGGLVSSAIGHIQAEQQSHQIAVLNAQMMTRTLSGQLAFRFSPIICLYFSPEFKQRLGIASAANVAMSSNQGQHIRDNHPQEAFEILAAMPKVDGRLLYIGRTGAHRGRFELVFELSKTGRYLFMAIRFVAASDTVAQDECWISTAFSLNDKTLKQKVRQKQLELQPA